MATVPTLTVDGVDQTEFIQDRTLGFRLQTLDFTLVDPAVTPALHDTVTLDDPEWHGRVSTVESHPWRSPGADHRFVKVTATNKSTAATDDAPFGISDSPNMSTTFPYRDLGVIRTLADQTDLASAELRVTATVYEPGLLPGMTVEVTSVAEGLTAEEVIVIEMSVNWLNDETPEFHLEMSDTGVPITLGDLIHEAGCQCPPWTCEPPDYTVVWSAGGLGDTAMISDPTWHGEQLAATSETCTLYAGATYTLEVSGHPLVFPGETHPHPEWGWVNFAGLAFPTNVPVSGGGFDMGAYPSLGDVPPPLYGIQSLDIEIDTTRSDYYGFIRAVNDVSHNSYLWVSSFALRYVSGPDPRFVDLPPCANGEPDMGQPVVYTDLPGDGVTTSFGVLFPYEPGSLAVFVNGVDWTPEVNETDPASGDYTLDYPPPLGATIRVEFRRA